MIGFIGLGVMGEPICRNLLKKSGQKVCAYDPQPEPLERLKALGVEALGSVREVAEKSDVVFLSLPGGKEVKLVCAGPGSLLIKLRAGGYIVDLSTTPVHERIKRMEANGVIKQYATLLDHTKVKKGLMVICYVSLKEHNKNAGVKFIEAMQVLNEVIECYSISGEFDFMLKVVGEDMNAYYDFHVNKLSKIENMGHVQSVFVMGIIKQTHQLV